MDYFEFKPAFERAIRRLKLPAEATLQEPQIEVTEPPLGWLVEFFILFSDNFHIRIWESYCKIKGLQASKKLSWAYHYGPIEPDQSGSEGKLVRGAATNRVVLRIDTCSGLHLHFHAREPHYEQSRITGLVLESVDCWQFIKNVLKHRETGKPVEDIFRFKIRS